METLLHSTGLVYVLLFLYLTLTTIVTAIARYWYKARRDEIEAALKQEMVQRGMSADDIVRVLRASKSNAPEEQPVN